jgi:hypothetical protein
MRGDRIHASRVFVQIEGGLIKPALSPAFEQEVIVSFGKIDDGTIHS